MRVAPPGPTRTVVLVVCLVVLVGPGVPPSAAAGAGEAVGPGVDGVDRPLRSVVGVDDGGTVGPVERHEEGSTVAGSAVGPPGEDIVETDQVVIVVSMQPDGDARWRVEYRTELDDQNTTDAFESLQSDIEQNPDTYTARFAERIGATVEDAENATGREMTAENFAVEARVTVDNDGVVAYTFDWSNFANDTAGGYRVGDAIAGFFLDADTRLEVQWPANWTLASVDPEPDSSPERAVIWRGSSTDFGPEQPDLRFREGADRTATPTATPTADDTPSPTPADDGDGGTTDGTGGDPADDSAGGDGQGAGGLLVGALVAVVLVAAAVGVVYLRRPGAGPIGDAGGPVGDAVDDSGAGGAAADAGDDDAEGPDASDGTGADDQEDDADEGPPIDEELLSNEERVLHLLEREGGRMKQQEVVEELGWTEAKTSQVVSGMREEGTIESFRLGRENVLTLPDEDLDPTEDN